MTIETITLERHRTSDGQLHETLAEAEAHERILDVVPQIAVYVKTLEALNSERARKARRNVILDWEEWKASTRDGQESVF